MMVILFGISVLLALPHGGIGYWHGIKGHYVFGRGPLGAVISF